MNFWEQRIEKFGLRTETVKKLRDMGIKVGADLGSYCEGEYAEAGVDVDELNLMMRTCGLKMSDRKSDIASSKREQKDTSETTRIEHLGLSQQNYLAMIKNGVKTIKDIRKHTEEELRSMKIDVEEISVKCKLYGIKVS